MRQVLLNNIAVTPSKIVCVGRNYAAHIEELGNEVPAEMVVFIKPNSAIGQHLYSSLDEPLHYEGELAFLVEHGQLAAVGFGLDLTKRNLQSTLKGKGLPWERAKAFDGAALFSDFVSLPQTLDALEITLSVDGVQRQRGGVRLMMYPPQTILAELQQFLTLEDGDIIMTGTPSGVGEVRANEVFDACVMHGMETLVSQRWQAR